MRYNDTLKKQHEERREETIKEILEVIETIKSFEGEHTVITAKKILDNSNLSRSVLYKEHVLKIWNPSVWEKRYNHKISKSVQNDIELMKNVDELLMKNEKLENEIKQIETKYEKMKEKFENEKKRTEVYQMDFEELKVKNQKLLGECQRLHSILNSKGIQI